MAAIPLTLIGILPGHWLTGSYFTATSMIGAFVIILDLIFQGLAVSLLFGVGASTVLTLVVIPVLYYHVMGRLAGPSPRTSSDILGNGDAVPHDTHSQVIPV